MLKKLGILFCACFLLASCSQPVTNETITPPPPVGALHESPGALASAPEPDVEPSPKPRTADLTERLSAAEGQDISLWIGDVGVDFLDLCPGFDEFTGRTAFESAPTDVTYYSRRYANGYRYESFHSTAGDYRDYQDYILITDAGAGDGFRQMLTVSGEEGQASVSGELFIEDLNLDGYADVKLFRAGYRGGTLLYNALLWGSESGCYYLALGFDEISKPVLDAEHKIYWGGWSVNWGEYRTASEYLDGRFVMTHRLEVLRDGEAVIEWALSNGEMRVVNKAAVDLGGDGPDPSYLEGYAATQAVWPGWVWDDMWDHYQYG